MGRMLNVVVQGRRKRERQKWKWMDVTREDMVKVGAIERDEVDWVTWKGMTLHGCPE